MPVVCTLFHKRYCFRTFQRLSSGVACMHTECLLKSFESFFGFFYNITKLRKRNNKLKNSKSIISYKSDRSAELLDRLNVVCMFKCLLRDCVSKENNTYIGLTTTTLSRRLTMHLNDSSSITLLLKTHSISKSKFRKMKDCCPTTYTYTHSYTYILKLFAFKLCICIYILNFSLSNYIYVYIK